MPNPLFKILKFAFTKKKNWEIPIGQTMKLPDGCEAWKEGKRESLRFII